MDQPFIMNLANAPAFSHPRRATVIDFEPDDAPCPEVGVNVQFMQPGQPDCRYHSERSRRTSSSCAASAS